MKLGISSYAFGWAVSTGVFTPETLVDFAIAHRVPVIQFGDHVPLHRLEPMALEQLAARSREAGIAIETGARGLRPAHLETYVAISKCLGAGFLRFVIDEQGHEPTLDQIAGMIHDSLPLLSDAAVTLGIENHDRFSCSILRRLVDDIDSPRVGICLDTANSLGAGEGIREVLAQLAPVCVNLHVKDFAIARLTHLMGFTVTGRALGEGMLPLDAVLKTVARYGRCETAVVETWPSPESELSATLAKEQDWAIRSVQALRSALDKIDRTNLT